VERGPRRRQGHRGLGGDVADGAAERSHQDVDEGLQMMPVLVGLRVEDEVAVAGREIPETCGASYQRGRKASTVGGNDVQNRMDRAGGRDRTCDVQLGKSTKY
jgi:hypothetical protein